MNDPFVIAEAGVNHNGDIGLALDMIEASSMTGADAVKFQTFSATKLVTNTAEKATYQKASSCSEETQFEMLKRLELSLREHHQLMQHCERFNVEFLSTPFDIESLEFLTEELNLQTIKIASGDITNGPLLLSAALKHGNIILSTGMSNLGEIEAALGVLCYGFICADKPVSPEPSMENFRNAYASDRGQQLLSEKVTLMHCTTEYPAPFDQVNLNAMKTMASSFQLQVGYSDHTEGIAVPIGAVALGATVIEKHFTLSRDLAGPDHRASMEPSEFAEMVRCLKEMRVSLGNGVKYASEAEQRNMEVARKSLVASRPIKAGDTFNAGNLTVKRPGKGINPMQYWDYIGETADKNLDQDQYI